MNSEAEGIRLRGRPKLGWKEGVTNSLRARELSMEEGRVKASDRVKWRKIVKK